MEEEKTVPKPKNLDFLDHFIFKIRRDHQIFKDRSWKFINITPDGIKLVDKVKIPDEQIVCDSCNILLTAPIIDLIIYLDPEGKSYVEKALCQECIDKYYSHLFVANLIRCITCNKKIEKFKNKLSEKEFLISGICQECQDSVFGDNE